MCLIYFPLNLNQQSGYQLFTLYYRILTVNDYIVDKHEAPWDDEKCDDMPMKVTVCFDRVRVIVPCGDGDLLVKELTEKAVLRYKKATGKVSCEWIQESCEKICQSIANIRDQCMPNVRMYGISNSVVMIIAYIWNVIIYPTTSVMYCIPIVMIFYIPSKWVWWLHYMKHQHLLGITFKPSTCRCYKCKDAENYVTKLTMYSEKHALIMQCTVTFSNLYNVCITL